MASCKIRASLFSMLVVSAFVYFESFIFSPKVCWVSFKNEIFSPLVESLYSPRKEFMFSV